MLDFIYLPILDKSKGPPLIRSKDYGKKWTEMSKEELRKISKKYDTINKGIACGKEFGLTCIDFDYYKDDDNHMTKKLYEKYYNKMSYIVSGNGVKSFFKYCDKLKSGQIDREGYHVDILNNGYYAIAAGSVHPSGVKYMEVKNLGYLAEVPEELVEELNKIMNKSFGKTVDKKEKIKNLSNQKEKIKINMEKNILYDIMEMWSCENYESWLYMGSVLYNEGYDIDVWENWSKQSDKYQDGCCIEPWKEFSKRSGNKSSIGSLLNRLREVDEKGYKEIVEKNKNSIKEYSNKMELEQNLRCTVESMKEYFPKNKLEVSERESMRFVDENGNEYYSLELMDKYCPIQKKEDDNTELVADIKENGLQIRSLESSIFNQKYPVVPVSIPEKYRNMIFVKVDNNITNNYITNDEKMELLDFDEDINIVKIFGDDDMNLLFLNSLNGTHYDIGKVIYELYKDEFKCIMIKGEWYEFRGHRWRKGSMRLRQRISEEIVGYYKKARKEYKSFGEKEKKKVVVIEDLIKKLKTTGFKNNIMSEVNEIFYNNLDGFLDKLNENKSLIGFENGVYDLEKDEFREGKCDDYITMSVGYNYRSEYSNKIDDIKKFFEDIIPEKNNREYLLTYLASCLGGNNPDELFHIFSGKTRNGKSKLRDLLKYTFGEYFTTISSNLLTKERPSPSNPQPDIMCLKGKRLIVASEPEKNKKINTGFMKFMTGNDPIRGRGLYEKEEYEYEPQFKILLLCNDIPLMDSNDLGVWSRSRCIEFPTTFVENPTGLNEKKVDKYLSNKLRHWKEDFMLLLLEYNKKYREEGLKVTSSIKNYTKEYQKENDVYYDYLEERTKKSDKNIHMTTIYEDFKKWYIEKYEVNIVPKDREIRKGISKYYKIENSVWGKNKNGENKNSTGINGICIKE